MLARLVALALACLGAVARAQAPAAGPPPEAVLADLPFLDWPEPNRVVVDLAPPGSRPFRLMLDTGASDSVLTPRYARELGVTARRHRDRPNARPTVLGRDLQFWIDTESSESASRTGWEYGLLGGTFLAEYVLELDFGARRVRFLDPQRFRVPETAGGPDEAVLPLKVVGNRPLLKLAVEGKTLEVLLDTGAPGTLVLSGASARKAGLEWTPLASLAGGGVLGPIELYLVEAKSLALGPFEFAPAPLEFAPKGLYNQGSATDSALGFDLLTRFHVRIDYPRKRLWLHRRDAEPLTWMGLPWPGLRRSGLLAYAGKESVLVFGVLPGSPAEKLGLRAGDTIGLREVDGARESVGALLGRIERGERVTATRASGEAIEDVELGAPAP